MNLLKQSTINELVKLLARKKTSFFLLLSRTAPVHRIAHRYEAPKRTRDHGGIQCPVSDHSPKYANLIRSTSHDVHVGIRYVLWGVR